jgi:hydroxyacylglutathione hydrolase
MILKNLVVGMYGTNCYIVGSDLTKEGMIIDPGDEPEEILRAVKNLKLSIKLIVITHGHPDHMGALEEVKQRTEAKLAIHKDDAGDLPPGLSADMLLKGGDKVHVADMEFLVLHTPGHSPGGICLYGHGVLFCGDTLFHYSVGRTDFPGGSSKQLIDSIITKLMVLPENTVVYPGHESMTSIGDEKRHNPFLR